MKPARRVVTRAPHRTVGVIMAGWLQPQPIEYESQLERRFVHLALVCPDVVGIQSQPFKLKYTEGDQERHHTPDYLVRLFDGRAVVAEVKPAKFLPAHRSKFDAASALLAHSGLAYHVITEAHVPAARHQQVEVWLRYARGLPPARELSIALAALGEAAHGIELHKLLALGVSETTVFHLLGRRQIACADGLTSSDSTRLITLNHGDTQHERFCFDRWFGSTPWRTHLAA